MPPLPPGGMFVAWDGLNPRWRPAASAGSALPSNRRLPLPRQILERLRVEQRYVELSTLELAHLTKRRVGDDLPDAAA
jgi:hypothetical protein